MSAPQWSPVDDDTAEQWIARWAAHVERVTEDFTHFWWESWCEDHPMPNGDTGVVFDQWHEALDHAIAHAATHNEAAR